jgi:hypothetical protein
MIIKFRAGEKVAREGQIVFVASREGLYTLKISKILDRVPARHGQIWLRVEGTKRLIVPMGRAERPGL